MNRLRRQLIVRSLEDRTAPATFTVMNLNDSGADSLRDCISKANTTPGADTIDFKSGLAGTITIASRYFVTDALTITGPGPANLTINGNNSVLIFTFAAGAAGGAMNLSGLTLTKGNDNFGTGAIEGTKLQVTMSNCVVTGNTSKNSSGAAARLSSSTFVAMDCTFTNNTASTSGGAFYFTGDNSKSTLIRCVVSGNAANTGAGIQVSEGYLLLDNTSVTNNIGPGVTVSDNFGPATVIVRNSTISGNSSTLGGGGLRITGGVTATVQNSTITNNSSTSNGGGILRLSGGGTLSIESSIVSGNTGSAAAPDIISDTVVSVKTSAIGSANGFTISNQGGNLPFQPHANLKLGALTNNGGPTLTHLPALDSPLLHVGSNPASSTTDQRGVTRKLGSAVDIGAVEVAGGFLLVSNINDSGPGSLRLAVSDANLELGSNTVSFDPAFFFLAKFIDLTGGEIPISDAVTINGTGPSFSWVTGSNLSRIFNTTSAPTGAAIAINGLNLISGKAATHGGAIFGGDEQISLTNCTIGVNQAVNGSGGAIAITNGGSLTVTDCTIYNNSAPMTQAGGAISVTGLGAKTTIQRSTITGNSAGSAGGIYAFGYAKIENSAIVMNTASNANGGGIAVRPLYAADAVIVRNCTISGNKAVSGGGVVIINSIGAPTFQNCTITANTATSRGGGIAQLGNNAPMLIESSVVSGNTCVAAPDIYTFDTNNVNINFSAIGSKTGIKTFNGDATTLALLGMDFKLGPLADNRGPTQTHHPLAGSPLIDAGSNPSSLATDQRGATRVLGSKTDIGAVEVVPNALLVTNANDAGTGSLRQTAIDANISAGANMMSFDPGFFNVSKTINLISQIVISETVTIAGPGTSLVNIDGGNKTRLFNIGATATGAPITIIGLTMTGGKGDPVFNAGGAIVGDDEQLNLVGCKFTGNYADIGGAVHLNNGSLTATDCEFTNNSSIIGGAFAVTGTSAKTILQRCSISGNSSASSSGGGIYAQNYLLIENSTIALNKANNGVGGGVTTSGPGPVIVRHSTISGNSAGTEGGGIFLINFNGALTIQNSTITNNSSGAVGGIARFSGTGSIFIESSIVSGNVSGFAPDIYSKGLVEVKTSAIGSGSGFTKTDKGGNLPFQAHANLKLGLLAANGGPTQTHLPAVTSPLIGKGSNPSSATLEQRGVGFPRILGASIDIGAVEVELPLIVTNADDSGLGSLRHVLSEANGLGGPDTVTFDPTFFATPRTITLTTGELAITDSVTIPGPGAATLTISGNKMSRVFNLSGPGSAVGVLTGLTITDGKPQTGLMWGGGILAVNMGVTIQNCVVVGNSAESFGGIGALGPLTLIDSQVINNAATNGNVGGVSGTPALILRSTISGNSASNRIGGIYAGGSLTMEASTVSNNSAAVQMGGICFADTFAAAATIINSTVSGNSAAGDSGGICLGYSSGQPFNGTFTVRNSTITNNKSSAGKAGGIGRLFGSGDIVLESSIVSGNFAAAGGPDLYTTGTVTAKVSLIGNIAGVTTFNPDAFTSLSLGKAPLLGNLANNGGPTQTHSLLANSPALNNGSNPQLLSTDQRGKIRAVGNIDIGAFEMQPGAKVTSVTINDGSPQRSRVTSVTLTFDQHVIFLGSPVSAFQLKRQSDNKLPALSALVDDSGPGTSVTLSFSGATAVDFGSLADGRYTLTVFANKIGADGLDGNGDMVNGDDYVLVGNTIDAPKLFRLFGDADGDGSVTTIDFAPFRSVFGLGSSIFDFNNDGFTNTADFAAFRQRFGITLPP